MFYRKINKTRPGVSYRAERNLALTRGSVVKLTLDKDMGRFLNPDDLVGLTDIEQKKLQRDTARIIRCGNCKLFYIVNLWTLIKFSPSHINKFGYYYKCDFCRWGVDIPEKLKEKSLILENAFNIAMSIRDKEQGIITTDNE